MLRVATGGGFVPLESSLRTLPSYTLYGDGTWSEEVTAIRMRIIEGLRAEGYELKI